MFRASALVDRHIRVRRGKIRSDSEGRYKCIPSCVMPTYISCAEPLKITLNVQTRELQQVQSAHDFQIYVSKHLHR